MPCLRPISSFTGRLRRVTSRRWTRSGRGRAPVACLHPGWTALKDRDAIIESWAGILSNPDAPRIACFDEQAFLYGDVALVLCEEELEGGTLAASNFFVREDGVWRIAHHQAPLVHQTNAATVIA